MDNQIHLNLMEDNTVTDANERSFTGDWTMVYDEGFDIQIGGIDYFAFSKFYKSGSEHKSDCSSTLVGWYHDKYNNMQGCFKGKKADGKEIINDEVKHAYVVQPIDTFSDSLIGEKHLVKTDFTWENDGFL